MCSPAFRLATPVVPISRFAPFTASSRVGVTLAPSSTSLAWDAIALACPSSLQGLTSTRSAYPKFFIALATDPTFPWYIGSTSTVSYTHLRAHETRHDLVCRLLLEKK